MELFHCIGSNSAATVGLHSEVINSPIICTDSAIGYDCTTAH